MAPSSPQLTSIRLFSGRSTSAPTGPATLQVLAMDRFVVHQPILLIQDTIRIGGTDQRFATILPDSNRSYWGP